MITTLAEMLESLPRESLLAAARRLRDGDMQPSWPNRRVAQDLATYLDLLVDGLSMSDIQNLAHQFGIELTAGRKAEQFASLACAVGSRSENFEGVLADAMAQSLPKSQLLAAASRLGDEDIRPTWSLARIAGELASYEHGTFLDALTVSDLQSLLDGFELPRSGLKAELVARVALRLVDTAENIEGEG